MFDTLRHWLVATVALMAAWPVGSWALRLMSATDGQFGVPLVLSTPMITALLAAIVAAIWFAALAVGGGFLTHRYTGMLIYGLCWMTVARRGARVDDLMRFIDESGRSFGATWFLLAIEAAIWAAPALLVLVALIRTAPNIYPEQEPRFSPLSMRGLGITFVLGLVLSWVFLRTEAKGQVVFGFAAAMALAVMITRLIWPRTNASVLFFVPLVIGVLAPLSGLILVGSAALPRLADGTFWPLARLLPLDAICGGLFGVAAGIALARSFGAEEEAEDRPSERRQPSQSIASS